MKILWHREQESKKRWNTSHCTKPREAVTHVEQQRNGEAGATLKIKEHVSALQSTGNIYRANLTWGKKEHTIQMSNVPRLRNKLSLN